MVNGGFERLIDNFGVILIKGIGHLVVKCEFEKKLTVPIVWRRLPVKRGKFVISFFPIAYNF
jgi:hypothetical protein